MIRRPPKSTLFPSTPLSGPPLIRVAAAADARGAESASEEDAASDLPLPELGRDVDDDEAPSGRGNTPRRRAGGSARSEEHTSELQSRQYLVCRLLLEKKKTN